MSIFSSVKWFVTGLIGGRSFDPSVSDPTSNAFLKNLNPNKHIDEDNEPENVNKTASLLLRNDDKISAVLRAVKRDVIGARINIQYRTPDSAFNEAAEAALREWSKKGNCEITGRMHRGLAERTIVQEMMLRGGVLIRHHYSPKWRFGYKFEIIPLHMINTSKHDPAKGWFNGVNVNKNGYLQKVAVYKTIEKLESREISFKDITMYADPWVDATQITGVSDFAPALAAIITLQKYVASELDAASARASMNVVVRTHMFAEILKARRRAKGNLTEKDLVDIYDKFKMKNHKGINYIPIDDDVKNLNQNETGSVFNYLQDYSKKSIASSLGLSSLSTFRDMPSSYNAALLAAKLDDSTYDVIFADFTESVWREVIERRFTDAAIASGALSGMISSDKYWADPTVYRQVEFIRRSIAHIDPAKAEKGIEIALNNGTTTHIDEISKAGKDWQSTVRKELEYIAYKKRVMEELGLSEADLGLKRSDTASDSADDTDNSMNDEGDEE